MILSDNEFIIMNLLWKEDRPLSRAEILKGTPRRNWNPASVHLILNSMLSKGVLKITDETQRYGRNYEACITKAEYIVGVIEGKFAGISKGEIIKDLIAAYRKELGEDEIAELVEILQTPVSKRGRKKK